MQVEEQVEKELRDGIDQGRVEGVARECVVDILVKLIEHRCMGQANVGRRLALTISALVAAISSSPCLLARSVRPPAPRTPRASVATVRAVVSWSKRGLTLSSLA